MKKGGSVFVFFSGDSQPQDFDLLSFVMGPLKKMNNFMYNSRVSFFDFSACPSAPNDVAI
jgi:hypothetical protein